jgi:hypothetical protein
MIVGLCVLCVSVSEEEGRKKGEQAKQTPIYITTHHPQYRVIQVFLTIGVESEFSSK